MAIFCRLSSLTTILICTTYLSACSGSNSDSVSDDMGMDEILNAETDQEENDSMTDEVMDGMLTDTLRLISNVSELDGTETLLDSETGLVWINDIRFCFAGVTRPEDSSCDILGDMAVAGFTNWRLPTSDEMSGVTLAVAADESVRFNFINPSCAVMTAIDGWVFTENSSSPGTVSLIEPGNAGVRCVSDNSESEM